MTTLPDFLVIGAMKSGTTTIYNDLARQNGVVLTEKESHILSGSTEGGKAAVDPVNDYAATFANAAIGSTKGDVSTTYSMSSTFPGVVEAASRHLNASTKVVYIVREPLARIISHYHHDNSSKRTVDGIDWAIVHDNRFIDYTKYHSQLEPWIDLFGSSNVHVIQFETYMSNRERGTKSLLQFLDIDPQSAIISENIHNASAGKPVATGAWQKLSRSHSYRSLIRPLLPERVKTSVARRVLPKADSEFSKPSRDTIEFIGASIEDDLDRLANLVGAKWWSDSPVTPWH